MQDDVQPGIAVIGGLIGVVLRVAKESGICCRKVVINTSLAVIFRRRLNIGERVVERRLCHVWLRPKVGQWHNHRIQGKYTVCGVVAESGVRSCWGASD